jgi:MerR family transcriptional regulator/heat shock protein HspR
MSETNSPIQVPQNEPVFTISVVAKMLDLHPQTLRQYDRMGLVQPARVSGKNRMYSHADIQKLQEIVELTKDGVPLRTVETILTMRTEMVQLRKERDEYVAEKRRTSIVLWRSTRTTE